MTTELLGWVAWVGLGLAARTHGRAGSRMQHLWSQVKAKVRWSRHFLISSIVMRSP